MDSLPFNPNALEFIPSFTSPKPLNNLSSAYTELKQIKSQKTAKRTGFKLSEVVLEQQISETIKPQKFKDKAKKDTPNPMIKARIVVDDQIVTARIPKKDLYSGCYKVVPKKPSKLKQKIKETRSEEGRDKSKKPKDFTAREYVTQILTCELDNRIEELLSTLIAFYTKKKEKNARVKKKIVKGFKECIRSVNKQ